MGDFVIREYHPVEGVKSELMFAVYAVTHEDDVERLTELRESQEHRIRDQVITAARVVPLADFDDPLLRGFRRRILLRLRRAMPDLPVEDVVLSDFNFAEHR